ncbi:LysR family transcriptional regulator [Sphingomonas jatrophae]|uniref:DNA-binding transcriptional regulator, LysR family n=1 Tax=Sphingomonas jatrophae TaxID=1166337 RepID=A0A1I6JAU3_9SPHN|nr:LysR family transcriptional regulator [Sphingomonas jatrophae]SFR76107.1 DNA-binding transcriptional regulator, LysR family [Sphingomonas jatrophae]
MDRDYDLFVRIIEGGSLSAAARALRLSPAMVSKRLARLEERLGAQLIRRTTRRLEPTQAGARFYEAVSAILTAAADAEAQVAGRTRAVAGPLRLSAPTSFGRMHVAPLVARFLDMHPHVRIELDLSDGFTDLVAERVDLAIRITASVPPSLAATRLATSRRILCTAPAYLAKHGPPARLADLTQHRLLAAEGQLPWRLVRGGRPLTVQGESIVGTNSSEVVRELALAGTGIALRSLWDVGPDLAAGRLVRVLEDVEGSADVGIWAVHPRTPLVPAAVTAFTALLAEAFSPPAPWER